MWNGHVDRVIWFSAAAVAISAAAFSPVGLEREGLSLGLMIKKAGDQQGRLARQLDFQVTL